VNDQLVAFGGDEHDGFEEVGSTVWTDDQPSVGVLTEVVDDHGVFDGVKDVGVSGSRGDGPTSGSPHGNTVVRIRRRSAFSNEGDDDVGGVAVEVLAAPVVDRGGARTGVTGGDPHVAAGPASRAAMMNTARSM